MIYQEKPLDSNPKFEVVSCFVEYNGKILLLHRQDNKSEGNTWGVPAGKVKEKEEILNAIAREIKEETGLAIPLSKINYFKKIYVKYADYDFIYHIFSTNLDPEKSGFNSEIKNTDFSVCQELQKAQSSLHKQEKVLINTEEHKDFKWASPKDALNIKLIQDLDACIELFYKI